MIPKWPSYWGSWVRMVIHGFRMTQGNSMFKFRQTNRDAIDQLLHLLRSSQARFQHVHREVESKPSCIRGWETEGHWAPGQVNRCIICNVAVTNLKNQRDAFSRLLTALVHCIDHVHIWIIGHLWHTNSSGLRFSARSHISIWRGSTGTNHQHSDVYHQDSSTKSYPHMHPLLCWLHPECFVHRQGRKGCTSRRDIWYLHICQPWRHNLELCPSWRCHGRSVCLGKSFSARVQAPYSFCHCIFCSSTLCIRSKGKLLCNISSHTHCRGQGCLSGSPCASGSSNLSWPSMGRVSSVAKRCSPEGCLPTRSLLEQPTPHQLSDTGRQEWTPAMTTSKRRQRCGDLKRKWGYCRLLKD